jgi:hypothetical protein
MKEAWRQLIVGLRYVFDVITGESMTQPVPEAFFRCTDWRDTERGLRYPAYRRRTILIRTP